MKTLTLLRTGVFIGGYSRLVITALRHDLIFIRLLLSVVRVSFVRLIPVFEILRLLRLYGASSV